MSECKMELCEEEAVKNGYCKVCFAIKDALDNI